MYFLIWNCAVAHFHN